MDGKVPHPVEVRVGQRLKLRRTALNIRLIELARAVGISDQQLRKMENADSRVPAGRLYRLSRLLNVPVEFFFDDTMAVTTTSILKAELAELVPPLDLSQEKEVDDLFDAYYSIKNAALRRALLVLARELARDGMETTGSSDSRLVPPGGTKAPRRGRHRRDAGGAA